MSLKRRVTSLEAAAPRPSAWQTLQARYDLPNPPPGLGDEGKTLYLIQLLREQAVLEHHWPQLCERLRAELGREPAVTPRLVRAMRSVILRHASEGRPLALPRLVVETYLDYPAGHDDPDWPKPAAGQVAPEAEAGKVLDGGTPYDCELCGYAYPALYTPHLERGANGGITVLPKATPLFDVCLLCGGAVFRAGYWLRHECLPNGRRAPLKLCCERLPGIDYPPECWR